MDSPVAGYCIFPELHFLCYSWINSISVHSSLPQFTSLYRLTAIMGSVPIRPEHSFKMSTWKQGLPNKTEWETYFNWHAKTSKSLQDSKITSLKDSLQKANKELNTQWYLQQKTIGLVWLLLLPSNLLYLSTHSLVLSLNRLSTLKGLQDLTKGLQSVALQIPPYRPLPRLMGLWGIFQ